MLYCYRVTEQARSWAATIFVDVQETGREDAGLVCGVKFPIHAASVIGYVMMNAPSLRVAGEKMRDYQRLIADTMGMDFEDEGRHTIVKVQLWSDWYDELRYTMDLFMAAIFSWNQEWMEDTVVPP